MHTMSKMGVLYLTWQRALQKTLVPHKITLKQEYVLLKLLRTDYLLPSQIADMLFCDRPTATVIIKNMEREGWIRREKDTENGKQYRISLTEAGRKKYESLNGASGPGDMDRFDPLKTLSAEERELLDALLTKVLKNK